MSDQYGPATVTPLHEVKTEPRVNGYNQVTMITQPVAQSSVTIRSEEQTNTNTALQTSGSVDVKEPYWSNREQQCCLVDSGRRCLQAAGNASYSKRIQKTVVQRKLKLRMDNSVSYLIKTGSSHFLKVKRCILYYTLIQRGGYPYVNPCRCLAGTSHLHMRPSQRCHSKHEDQKKEKGFRRRLGRNGFRTSGS